MSFNLIGHRVYCHSLKKKDKFCTRGRCYKIVDIEIDARRSNENNTRYNFMIIDNDKKEHWFYVDELLEDRCKWFSVVGARARGLLLEKV